MDKPKPRFLKLDAHILAYLGDFMSMFEKSVQQQARNLASLQSQPPTPISKVLHTQGSLQNGQ
jgi:hypothetical protein